MAPKEKAIELVNKYFHLKSNVGIEGIYRSESLQCALIAVDEILEVCSEDEHSYKYWEDVRQEIKAFQLT